MIVEEVFSWPGLGQLTYAAIEGNDYPVIQAVFLLSSAAVILFNLIADITYGYLDPGCGNDRDDRDPAPARRAHRRGGGSRARAAAGPAEDPMGAAPRAFVGFWRVFHQSRMGMVGLVMLGVFFILVALTAPLFVSQADLGVSDPPASRSASVARVPARHGRLRSLGARPRDAGIADLAARGVRGHGDDDGRRRRPSGSPAATTVGAPTAS